MHKIVNSVGGIAFDPAISFGKNVAANPASPITIEVAIIRYLVFIFALVCLSVLFGDKCLSLFHTNQPMFKMKVVRCIRKFANDFRE